MKKLILGVFAVGMLMAEPSATRFSLSLTEPTTVAGTKLKAGDYKVEVSGTEATFKSEGKSVKIPATIKKDAKVYKYTTLEGHGSDINTIHVGGTDTSVVFGAAVPVGGGTD
jgi:hypothetical protein